MTETRLTWGIVALWVVAGVLVAAALAATVSTASLQLQLYSGSTETSPIGIEIDFDRIWRMSLVTQSVIYPLVLSAPVAAIAALTLHARRWDLRNR